jgi:hypothetical protein
MRAVAASTSASTRMAPYSVARIASIARAASGGVGVDSTGP